MNIPQQAKQLISGYEGLGGKKENRYYPYSGTADAKGVRTIGRGHVLSEAEKASGVIHLPSASVKLADGLTIAQVNELFDADLAPRWRRLETLLGRSTGKKVVDQQAAAFLSLFYNIEYAMTKGTPGVAWRQGDDKKAVAAFLLYVYSADKPQLGLWRRRMSEAWCFLTNQVVLAKTPAEQTKLEGELKSHKSGVWDLAVKLRQANHPWLK